MTRSRRSARRLEGADRPVRDEGSLVIALVMMLVGAMIVIPLLNYTMTVTRANRGTQDHASRSELVKGGLRVALQNPAQLYAACANSGRTTAVQLAVPPGLGLQSSCTTTNDALQMLPSSLRYAVTVVQAGANAELPPDYTTNGTNPALDGTIGSAWCTSLLATTPIPCGSRYPNSGNANTTAWTADTASTSTGGKIFSPQLPPSANVLGYAGGYSLPAGDAPGGCKVFFPGRYTDDVILTGSTPAYFVSGVYYFEKSVRISGDAQVVVGAGVVPGCADSDAIAVADAISAPLDAYSNGVGGTFIFGANGRLVVDNGVSSSGTGASLSFNRRLVPASDPLAALDDISIMSVNGIWNGTSTADLDIPSQLHVPVTLVAGTTPSDPWTQLYQASTLVSTPAAPVPCTAPPAVPAASCPIIDINLTSAAKVNVSIPGYIAVPQGSVSVTTSSAAAATNKTIAFSGGVLAAQMAVTGTAPASLQIGLLNPVVQKTFKITTVTTTGSPTITGTALVQVNGTGGYAVNSWVISVG
jgi:hypothetical protein